MSLLPGKRGFAAGGAVLFKAHGGAPALPANRSALSLARERVLSRSLPRLFWSAARTGRAGLAGLALIGASAVFLVSTQRPAAQDIAQMRADLAAARARAAAPPPAAGRDAPRALGSIPLRTDIPALLSTLFDQAAAAHLTLDSAKYEIGATKTGALVCYQISFPVDGAYTEVRAFIDSTLAAIPALAIEELSITRKTIADPSVEAQIHMTLFTRGAP